MASPTSLDGASLVAYLPVADRTTQYPSNPRLVLLCSSSLADSSLP